MEIPFLGDSASLNGDSVSWSAGADGRFRLIEAAADCPERRRPICSERWRRRPILHHRVVELPDLVPENHSDGGLLRIQRCGGRRQNSRSATLWRWPELSKVDAPILVPRTWCRVYGLFFPTNFKLDYMGDGNRAQIYHERQRLQFCLLHTLNNLFQEKDAFTRADLNSISERLGLDDPNKGSWSPISAIFKSHHNAITGNYDINVLVAALEGKGKSVVWHDRRVGAGAIDLDGEMMGIIVNLPVRRFAGLWRSRHWVALKRIDGVWYNLDSDFSAPCAFRDTEELREYLDGIISSGAEILLVT
ncbi:unnamed protein product [Cuscuta campestris]|uniref:ubiquitinyl hydrolase 1 n=1 Tax=Cuscuta campestris TaxID=132261 RepID=A0A484NAN1_9ASTE|nr:unnamed protein product [Cuscuta campestris]